MKHIKEFKNREFVRRYASEGRHYKDYSKEEIDKAITDSDDHGWSITSVMRSPHATPDQIGKVLDDYHHSLDGQYVDFSDKRIAAVSHPNATHDHIMNSVYDRSERVAIAALQNPNATHEHIHAALHYKRPDNVWEAAVNHPKATRENLEKALDLDNDYVQDVARERLANKNYATLDQEKHNK